MSNSRFNVGVTGHRDIDRSEIDRVIAATSAFLSDLQGRIPDTEIVVLSGLADGPDRLAAEVALDMGLQVHAVLPMPAAEYEKDFSPESLTAFRKFLAVDKVKVTELAMPEDGDRDHAYRQLTDCLIRKSNILLAYWDGEHVALPGGTADTLLSFLSETRQPGAFELVREMPIDDVGRDFAYWIPVRRAESDATVAEDCLFLTGVPDTNVILAEDGLPQRLQEQLTQINSYNADANALRQASDSLPTWGLPDVSAETRALDTEGLLDEIESSFEEADGLAVFYQSKSDRLFKAFSLTAAVLGLLFLGYAKLVASNALLYGYVALFFGGYLIFKVAGSRKWFAKHIMYRVVAETLRIKFFLRLAGADHLVNVERIARQAGIDKFTGFSWIGHVFKGAEPIRTADASTAGAEQRFEEARQLWVADQSSYFAKKIHALHHQHHRVERIKQGLLAATIIGIVVLILFKYPLMTEIPGTELQYKKLLVFFMGLFPFWLGVWEIYHNKMATKELLWQYRNLADAFALTEFQLDHAETVEHKRKILAGLATDALFENYLWTIHRFHREHEPPAAG